VTGRSTETPPTPDEVADHDRTTEGERRHDDHHRTNDVRGISRRAREDPPPDGPQQSNDGDWRY
jgi:hypothetical protein